tara:strand:- start:2090 stop:2692 length:603 start_codon:yes stop_codon:yes gene_type:complete
MKKKIIIEGRFISKFTVPQKYIKDLNSHYEKAKIHLTSYGPRLAGRLASELNIMTLIEKTKAFKYFVKCMGDHIKTSEDFSVCKPGPHHLDINGCWINDMVEGEYNPPHTHHDGTGWSTVLFLKVPEFIDDTKDPHKFKDGKLCFIMSQNVCHYVTPKVGDFYIFSASHQHCVMPFKTKKLKEVRRSMSFNFIVKENVVK